jgi:hypothetical protein
LAAGSEAHAAPATWDDGAGQLTFPRDWGLAANWDPDAVPDATADVEIGYTFGTAGRIDLGSAPRTINSFTKTSPNNVEIESASGHALTITSGNITAAGSNLTIIETMINIGGAHALWTVDPGQIQIRGGVTGTGSITVSSTNATTLTRTVDLSTDNSTTYTGDWIINSAIRHLANNAYGPSTTTVTIKDGGVAAQGNVSVSLANAFVIEAGGKLQNYTSSAVKGSLTLTGTLSGAGDVDLLLNVNNVITISGDASGFTGRIVSSTPMTGSLDVPGSILINNKLGTSNIDLRGSDSTSGGNRVINLGGTGTIVYRITGDTVNPIFMDSGTLDISALSLEIVPTGI